MNNSVNYADALIKSRRYEEIMSESSTNEFFNEAACIICEAAVENDIALDEEVNFEALVEAVVGLMSDEQLAMENAEDFIMEAADYILNEFKKVKEKKAAEKAAKLLKRATQSELAGGNNETLKKATGDAVSKAHNLINATGGGDKETKAAAKETLTKAIDSVKKSKEEGKLAGSFAGKGRDLSKKAEVSDYVKKEREKRSLKKIKAEMDKKSKELSKAAKTVDKATTAKASDKAVEKAAQIANKEKEFFAPAVVNQNTSLATTGSAAEEKGKNIAGKALDWAKDHKKGLAIGAGVAAATGGALYAAKKIADKKKAAAKAKEEEVKENYEYPEYNDLLEAVIAEFTAEELMDENATDFACEVADCLVEACTESGGPIEDAVVDKNNRAHETLGSKIKNGAVGKAAGTAADFVKNHKKAVGIGAGVAAAGAATAIAAKKIADKKKAAQQNQEEVKENYEYPEYSTLIENVVNHFMSEEEIMSENANQIAIATADYLIDNIDNM